MKTAHEDSPRAPQDIILRVLGNWDYSLHGKAAVAMTADVLAALKEAGYVIAPVHQGTTLAYTREQACAALNAAANLVSEHDGESSETIRQDDIVNLAVNGAMHLLDHPGASLDEIIIAQYAGVDIDDYDLDEGEKMPEKGSPRWNELVITRVRGWIA